jgi:hypothetical protein
MALILSRFCSRPLTTGAGFPALGNLAPVVAPAVEIMAVHHGRLVRSSATDLEA